MPAQGNGSAWGLLLTGDRRTDEHSFETIKDMVGEKDIYLKNGEDKEALMARFGFSALRIWILKSLRSDFK